MSNLKTRLAMFFVAVPSIFSILLLLPHYNHLVFHLLGIPFLVLAGKEMKLLLANKGIYVVPGISFLPGIFPVYIYLQNIGIIPSEYFPYFLFLLFAYPITIEAFIKKEEQLKDVILRIMGGIGIIVYPGFLSIFTLSISTLQDPGLHFFLFFWLVFANDTFAYLIGMLFGRNSQNFSVVSPKKSLVGFIGGFSFTIIFAVLWQVIFPQAFRSIPVSIVLGIAMGFSGIIGDLSESALKRSAQIKDSGDIIPGRGGILDSIDSVLLSGPVYLFILSFF